MTVAPALLSPAEAAAASPADARRRYREGLAVPTSGWAAGWTQANLVVLPRDWAFDMLLFGQRNPRPVPLLDVTDPGGHDDGARAGGRPAHRPAALPRLARRRARRTSRPTSSTCGGTTW